jgi:hypothetical protein
MSGLVGVFLRFTIALVFVIVEHRFAGIANLAFRAVLDLQAHAMPPKP